MVNRKERIILKIVKLPDGEYGVELFGRLSEQMGIVPLLNAIVTEIEQAAYEEVFIDGCPLHSKDIRYIG